MIDSVSVEMRDAPATEIGTVYGPLPTRISLGGLSVMRAGAPVGCCAAAASGRQARRGGGAGAAARPAAGGARAAA